MVETGLPPLLLRGAMQWGRHACRMCHSYALRRKSEARTLSRNGIGGSGGVAGGGDFGFAAFFATFRASSLASCLFAKSFASASTVSAGAPSPSRKRCWLPPTR
jgi:hypothetical protein